MKPAIFGLTMYAINMKTARQIREKCEIEINKLQSMCSHPSTTIMLEEWAVAHLTGKALVVCDICEKVIR